jgi:hypothetical protein
MPSRNLLSLAVPELPAANRFLTRKRVRNDIGGREGLADS